MWSQRAHHTGPHFLFSRHLVPEEVGPQRARVPKALRRGPDGGRGPKEAPEPLLPVPYRAAGSGSGAAVLPAAVLPAVHGQSRGGPAAQRDDAGHSAAGQVPVGASLTSLRSFDDAFHRPLPPPPPRSFPLHFDETSLFAGDEKEAAQLKVGRRFDLGYKSKVRRDCCALVSGGRQTCLPQHLQDHGLCGLLQVSPLGETAGKGAVTHTHTHVLSCSDLIGCVCGR